ncbi:hypothetical protein H4219_000412 [Mycoemilia scoparia]|uniref:Uncharacterized protein n=1 Tax=Mycoemilia scoparia TaxID=417184 RepID=A0A9W8AAN6_9FUNG|nr:hypothetical protein H4219_000412 [Mycoemilia scoparia]
MNSGDVRSMHQQQRPNMTPRHPQQQTPSPYRQYNQRHLPQSINITNIKAANPITLQTPINTAQTPHHGYTQPYHQHTHHYHYAQAPSTAAITNHSQFTSPTPGYEQQHQNLRFQRTPLHQPYSSHNDSIRYKVLPLFNGERIGGSVEELNELVRNCLRSDMENLHYGVKTILQAGFVTLQNRIKTQCEFIGSGYEFDTPGMTASTAPMNAGSSMAFSNGNSVANGDCGLSDNINSNSNNGCGNNHGEDIEQKKLPRSIKQQQASPTSPTPPNTATIATANIKGAALPRSSSQANINTIVQKLISDGSPGTSKQIQQNMVDLQRMSRSDLVGCARVCFAVSEVWNLVYSNIISFADAVFLPMRLEFKQATKSKTGESMDVREEILLMYREFIARPLLPKFYEFVNQETEIDFSEIGAMGYENTDSSIGFVISSLLQMFIFMASKTSSTSSSSSSLLLPSSTTGNNNDSKNEMHNLAKLFLKAQAFYSN